MFATNAEFNFRPGPPAEFDCHLNQFARTGLVNGGKWIFLNNFLFDIGRQKTAGIVAAHPEARLSEIICSKTKARWHGQTDSRHFNQICAFSPKERFHGAVAVGFFVPEEVNRYCSHKVILIPIGRSVLRIYWRMLCGFCFEFERSIVALNRHEPYR